MSKSIHHYKKILEDIESASTPNDLKSDYGFYAQVKKAAENPMEYFYENPDADDKIKIAFLKDYLKINPNAWSNIRYMDNPSEAVQMAAVEMNKRAILLIDNPASSVMDYVFGKRSDNIPQNGYD